MIDVCILGTGGMMPLPDRHLSSCMVRNEGRIALIDAGEGTQVAAQRYGWSLHDIDLILLTHLHADHVMGLPGILATMSSQGRKDPITIVGPEHSLEVIQCLCIVMPLAFRVNVLELPDVSEMHVGNLEVKAYPMDHDLPCFGYRFELQRQRKFLPEVAKELGIPQALWSELQAGKTVRKGLKRWKPDQVLGPERRGITLTFATDTRPNDALKEAAKDVDLLICEGIYGDEAKNEKALANGHMSLWQGLELAQTAGAHEIWFTHFSPSFKDQEDYAPLLDERSAGLASFAYDGRKKTLEFPPDEA